MIAPATTPEEQSRWAFFIVDIGSHGHLFQAEYLKGRCFGGF